jgi:hypothetical protein
MPQPRVCYKLLPLLLLGGLCQALPRAVSPRSAYLFLPRVEQQSGQPAATPDSGQSTPPPVEKLSLSDQVIQDVLEPLRAGVVSQNLKQIMSVFDKQAMPGYSNLQQELRAFFGLYSEVRFHYQLLQVAADKDHGSATAEMEMDALPYEATQIPARRSVQMRLKMNRTVTGWKVVEFAPADFFGPGFSRADGQ